MGNGNGLHLSSVDVVSTEDRIEGLSVLSLESRDTCSKATTNTDKVSKEVSRQHNTGLMWN